MSKKERGEFTLSDEELGSTEMVFIALTILESRGYNGLTELMSVLNDPKIILKVIRLLYGTEIKIPSLKEFVLCLRTAIYAFCDIHKKIHVNLPVKPTDIRKFMNITPEQEKEILDVFDQWTLFMHKQGRDPWNYMHINRNMTRKRMKMVCSGKKWTSNRY